MEESRFIFSHGDNIDRGMQRETSSSVAGFEPPTTTTTNRPASFVRRMYRIDEIETKTRELRRSYRANCLLAT